MYTRMRVCMCILINYDFLFCFLIVNFVSYVLSAVDLWYFHQFLWFIYLHCRLYHIYMYLYLSSILHVVWDECHIILYYILFYFFGVSLQIIKIFLLMKKYQFITIFFSFFFFFRSLRDQFMHKKKLVLYTGYFTNSLWFLLHVEICKSSRPPLFFLRYERLYIRICTCSLILYALYCFKSFVYLWISISTFCLL